MTISPEFVVKDLARGDRYGYHVIPGLGGSAFSGDLWAVTRHEDDHEVASFDVYP